MDLLEQIAKEEELLAAITTARAEYAEVAETGTPDVLRKASKKVRTAMDSYNAFMTEGANPCSECGGPPVAVRKNPAVGYEVGCSICSLHRSRGPVLAVAVANWNANRWIEVG